MVALKRNTFINIFIYKYVNKIDGPISIRTSRTVVAIFLSHFLFSFLSLSTFLHSIKISEEEEEGVGDVSCRFHPIFPFLQGSPARNHIHFLSNDELWKTKKPRDIRQEKGELVLYSFSAS